MKIPWGGRRKKGSQEQSGEDTPAIRHPERVLIEIVKEP